MNLCGVPQLMVLPGVQVCACMHGCFKLGWCNNFVFAVVFCSLLANLTNGQVLTTDIVYQSTVTYSCDNGYTLSGNQLRTCQANGQWSGSDPDCDCEYCYT